MTILTVLKSMHPMLICSLLNSVVPAESVERGHTSHCACPERWLFLFSWLAARLSKKACWFPKYNALLGLESKPSGVKRFFIFLFSLLVYSVGIQQWKRDQQKAEALLRSLKLIKTIFRSWLSKDDVHIDVNIGVGLQITYNNFLTCLLSFLFSASAGLWFLSERLVGALEASLIFLGNVLSLSRSYNSTVTVM